MLFCVAFCVSRPVLAEVALCPLHYNLFWQQPITEPSRKVFSLSFGVARSRDQNAAVANVF